MRCCSSGMKSLSINECGLLCVIDKSLKESEKRVRIAENNSTFVDGEISHSSGEAPSGTHGGPSEPSSQTFTGGSFSTPPSGITSGTHSGPPSGGPPSGPPGPYKVKSVDREGRETGEGTLELKDDTLTFQGKGQEPIHWELRVLRR